jgi:hypothetical protein
MGKLISASWCAEGICRSADLGGAPPPRSLTLPTQSTMWPFVRVYFKFLLFVYNYIMAQGSRITTFMIPVHDTSARCPWGDGR